MLRSSILALAGLLPVAGCTQDEDQLPVPDMVDPPTVSRPAEPIAPLSEPAAPSPTTANVDQPPVRGLSVRPPSAPNPFPPPPPPPPSPPPSPSIIESVKGTGEDKLQGSSVLVEGANGPRESLFLHLVDTYRNAGSLRDRPICLHQLEADRVKRIARDAESVFGEDRCGWKDGGVILLDTGEPALFVHAAVDCSGHSCSAEGGATYGNLGAEGFGYRLRRTASGWTIRKAGIMWVS